MISTIKSALYWTCAPSLDVTQPTVILLHAAWMSSTMFDETIGHLLSLLPNTNLVCVDLNDHGKTTSGRKTFTLWDQANDVVALMDELKIQKATFAGISMGAAVVLRIALAHPSRITALTLMGSTAEASTPEGNASTQQMRDIWVSTPSPSEDIMDIGIRSWGGDPDVTGPRAKRIKQYWVTRHSGAESVDAILQSVNERDALLPRLHEITVPVLLIHGEKDETWELEGALRIQDAIGKDKAKTYIVKDSGHLVIHMRDSEDVSQAIAKFINQVPLQNS